MNLKMQIRINKYLSDCGIASRRKVEELVLQGRVMINNKIVSNLATKIDSENDKVQREYDVKLDKELTDDDKNRLISGVTLDKKKSRFESIFSPQKKNKILVRVKCYEGRNHFVKRMFASLGYNVKSLNRCSYAGLTADIPIGAYRRLSLSEINKITNHYAL